MSRRVVLLLGVGLLLIAGAFFLLKYELTDKEDYQEQEAEPETITAPDEKTADQPGAGTEN